MILQKGLDLLRELSENCKSGLICAFRINPWVLKSALGLNYPWNSTIIFSGETSDELKQSIPTKQFVDSSCIPLHGQSFHSKIYIFEKITSNGHSLEVVIPSFNATSAGLTHNLEFWSYSSASYNFEGPVSKKTIVDLILSTEIKLNKIDFESLFNEEVSHLVVAPAIEVLWRLTNNGIGLAPGKPVCVSDKIFTNKKYLQFTSILVHTLGNNSLSKALFYMIKDTINKNQEICIRVISPYHNFEGIKYLHKTCLLALGTRQVSVKIELLTVFPPDFPEKFSDPKFQPFAPLDKIKQLKNLDPRISFKIRLWRKDSTSIPQNEATEKTEINYAFLHGKAIMVKSGEYCSFLLGSPNLTDSAFGPGPDLNFETAIWERDYAEATALWSNMEPLFTNSAEANSDDYDVLKTWFENYSSDNPIDNIKIRNRRDAIERFVTVSVIKKKSITTLLPYKEENIFFDEKNDTFLKIALDEEAPQVSNLVRILISPDNLEQSKKPIEQKLLNRKTILKLPLNYSKAQTLSIGIEIKSKLLEEREVHFRQKGNRVEVDTVYLPIGLAQDASLLIHTTDGCREINCIRTKSNSLIAKLEKDEEVTKKHALLRIYTEDAPMVNAIGYFRLRYRKRSPEFEVKIAGLKGLPLSIFFKELDNPLNARILPESIYFSFFDEDGLEIPSVSLASKRFNNYPLVESTLMVLSNKEVSSKLTIEVKFTDEHEGYYVHRFTQDLGYWEIKDRVFVLFFPKELFTTFCLRKSMGQIEEICSTVDGNFRRIESNFFPSLIDSNGSTVFISNEQLPQICVKLLKPHLTINPDEGWITSNSPITLQFDYQNMNELHLVKTATLDWSMHRWINKEKGPSKYLPFASSTSVRLSSDEIRRVEDRISSNSNRESILDFEITYDLIEGYTCKYQQYGIIILPSERLFDKLYSDIWGRFNATGRLLSDLCALFCQYLAVDIPLDLFKRALKGSEIAMEQLMEKLRREYTFSPRVCPDGHFEFALKDAVYTDLVEQTCNIILNEAFLTFSQNKNMPNITEDVFFKGLKARFRAKVESTLVITGQENSKLIAPALFFGVICSNWKSII